MAQRAVRVFLADDHVMVREALADVVDRVEGLEVVGQCGDGAATLAQLGDCKPDVVLLDISMPGLNGLDVCREYGASGYLLKESAADQLVEAIQAVSRGELYLGPGISCNVLERIVSGGKDPYDKLTTRERQVLQLIAEGKTNRQAAEELGLAVKTVDTHRMRLMRKLDIHDQTTLVKFAVRRGIVSVQ